jgi:hypothetical protein
MHDCSACHCDEECIRERCEFFDLENEPESVDQFARTNVDLDDVPASLWMLAA